MEEHLGGRREVESEHYCHGGLALLLPHVSTNLIRRWPRPGFKLASYFMYGLRANFDIVVRWLAALKIRS